MRELIFSFLLVTVIGRRTRRRIDKNDLQDQLTLLTERVLALEEEVKTLKTTNAGLHEIVEAKEAVDDIEFLLTKNEELTGRGRKCHYGALVKMALKNYAAYAELYYASFDIVYAA